MRRSIFARAAVVAIVDFRRATARPPRRGRLGPHDLRGAVTAKRAKGREEPMIPVQESAGSISFAVKVHPRARKNAITGELGDALKLALTAPPVEGKANQACIEFFANLLKLPRSSVTIAAGQSSRNKLVRIAGISAAEFRHILGT